jgi:hypothetical protein
MANEAKIHDVRMLTPISVTFTDLSDIDWPAELSDKRKRKAQTELFYFDQVTKDVKYLATPTLPVPEYLKEAIIQHIGQHTPTVKVPAMPEKPAYTAESFTQV